MAVLKLAIQSNPCLKRADHHSDSLTTKSSITAQLTGWKSEQIKTTAWTSIKSMTSATEGISMIETISQPSSVQITLERGTSQCHPDPRCYSRAKHNSLITTLESQKGALTNSVESCQKRTRCGTSWAEYSHLAALRRLTTTMVQGPDESEIDWMTSLLYTTRSCITYEKQITKTTT